MSSETQARYADPLPVGRAAIGALGIGVLLDAHRLVYAVAQYETTTIAASMPSPTLHAITRVATVILFIVWFDRVWRNFAALAGTAGQPKRATFAAFFLPPLFLYRPVRILRDVWRGLPAADSRFPRLLVIWWITFLVPVALTVTTLRRGTMSADAPYLGVAAGESLNVVAGLLAIVVVHRISTRQRDAVRLAPLQRKIITPPFHGTRVELLIREQTKRRPPLERVADFCRGLVWRDEPRRR